MYLKCLSSPRMITGLQKVKLIIISTLKEYEMWKNKSEPKLSS